MKKKLIYSILIIAALLALVLGGLLLFQALKVERIICASQFGPCATEIDAEIDKFQGLGIISALGQVKKTLGSDARVSQFSVRFIFPSTINVDIIAKKGEAALGQQGVDNFLILDKTGRVIAVEKTTSLPIINVNDGTDINYQIGASVPDNLIFALNLSRQIFAGYGVKLIIVEPDRIEVSLKSVKVIFPTQGEVDVLIGSLNLILSRLNNAQGEIRMGEIDLRYKNPIIR